MVVFTVTLREGPLITFLLDEHSSLLVEADAPGVEDCRREDSVTNGREALLVKVAGLGFASIDPTSGINEFLDGNVAVTPLAIKMTSLGRRVLKL